MKKSLSLIIGVVIILLVGVIVWTQTNPDTLPANESATVENSTNDVVENSNTDTTNTVETSSGYTMADVATHNDASSCWSVIDGHVYDLTQWIPQHPGGEEAIRALCGVDGTEVFHNQHGDAPKQAQVLAGFKIGDLAN